MRAEGALFTPQGPIFSDPPTPSDLRNRVRVVTRHTLGIKDDSPLHNLTGVCGVSSPPFPSARFLITWPEKLACDWLLRAAYYGTSAGGGGVQPPSRDNGTPQRLSSACNWPFPVYPKTGVPFPYTTADPAVDWLVPASLLPHREAGQIGPTEGRDWLALETRWSSFCHVVCAVFLSRGCRPGKKRSLCLGLGSFLRVTVVSDIQPLFTSVGCMREVRATAVLLGGGVSDRPCPFQSSELVHHPLPKSQRSAPKEEIKTKPLP